MITFGRHSTVWDGGDLIFDFNYQAFGVDPNECLDNASDKEATCQAEKVEVCANWY